MNNEEKILGLLEQLVGDMAEVKEDVAVLKSDVAVLNAKINIMEGKLNGVYEQVGMLSEFKVEISHKINDLVAVVKQNTFDIAIMKTAV